MPTGLFDDLVEQPVSKTGLFDDLVSDARSGEELASIAEEEGAPRDPRLNPPLMVDPGQQSAWQRFRDTQIGHNLFGPTSLEQQVNQEVGGTRGGIGLANIIQGLLNATTPGKIPGVGTAIKATVEALNPLQVFGPAGAGVGQGVGEVAANFPLAPFGGGTVGKLALGAFGGEYLGGLPEAREQNKQALAEGDIGQAASIQAQTMVGGALLATPFALPRILEMYRNRNIIDPEVLPPVGPKDRGLLLPENTYSGPTEGNPVGGATFVVDPSGRTLQMNQLTPMEQREAMRGPREYSPREESVRPAQQAPVILGQQPAQARPVYYTGLFQDLVEPVVPSKAPVEPSGGEVSFRAQAAAEGIPNAGQQAQSAPRMRAGEAMIFDPEFYRQTAKGVVDLVKFSKEMVDKYGPDVADAVKRGVVLAQSDRQQKLTEGENYASTIRSGEEQAPQGWYGQKVSGEARGNDLQQLRQEEQPAESTGVSQEARGEVVRSSEFTPALKTKEGNVIVGEQGKVHNDIYAAQPGIQGAILRLQQPEHGFVKGDKFYSREEAAKALDELEPLQSERLRELQSEQGGSIPSTAKGMQTGIKPGQGKKRGSFLSPIGALIEKFKNREKELRGDTFALSGPRIAIDPKESGFPNPLKEVDAQQLWNRVKNKLTPIERDFYEKVGIDKAITSKGKITPEEAGRLMQEGGLQVKVESYGMEGKVSEFKAEHDVMTHNWLENLDTKKGQEWADSLAYENDATQLEFLRSKGWQGEDFERAKRYIDLERQVSSESTSGPRATSAYSQVSAFPTTEPMPDWTTTKSGKNVQRVDVVIPVKRTVDDSGRQVTRQSRDFPDYIWQPDNLHENLPNTLGWAMIQYKTGPNGEKIAVIAEAQSRWGQERRESVNNRVKALIERGRSAEEAKRIVQEIDTTTVPDHPLLHDYNRLILKAAIDQARKEGATHIVVSDAETAMMTEGHDLNASQVGHEQFNSREEARNKAIEVGGKLTEVSGKWHVDWTIRQPIATQDSGMRLNYDTILPKIAEELTGSKGEKVSLGEHKNAFEERFAPGTFGPEGESARIGKRQNLIFKNPDNTPKTDVSGLMYPLPKAEQKFSLFEKDRPESVAGRLYGGIPFLDPALLKDTAKNVKEVGVKLGEYFKGAADKVLPALEFDTKSPLPDYQPKEIANKIFSQPFASEKMPVLGRLMGGKARIRTPQDEAVATWYAERHGVGPAIASHLGEQIRGRIDKVFEVDEKGNLNVKPTEGPGQSLKMSDVFEGLRKNPTAYRLTPAQSQVFNTVIEPVAKRMSELARKYDLIDEMVDESGDFKPYFPRIVTKHPKIEDKGPTSAFKKRAFSTEKEGWDRGYEYETSAEKRLVSGVERLYRAIANQRLATDPILGAKSEAQVKADIAESFREELGSGAMTQAKIDRIAEGIRTRGQVMQPILIRKIFDPETAKMLNREFAAEQSRIIKSVASANSFLKATQLGFDLGVGQIQMLPMLYNNPKVWAQSQFKSLQSMASPKFFSEYMQQPENVKAGSELAQMGSSVGRMQEMMSGVGEGQLITKIPVVGDVAQAFGRQFQTALDVAKVELWKALRETAPKSEWPKLVRGIETSLLSGRQESAMVPHGRALLERVALLAPSYYRGAVDSIAGLAEQGASGKVIRNTMGRFVLGGLITYYAVAKMVGMDDKQIKERLDPTRSDYLNWAIKQDDGSVVNVGYGGVHRSMLRLLANSVKTSVEHPENWKSLSSEKNPLSRWLRGHSAPIPSAGWDAVTGEDFLGRESNVKTIAQGRLPLIAQQAITRPGEAPAKPIEYGASFVGMTATPENFSSRRGREVDQAAKERFGKSFEQLSIGQRLNVERVVEKKLAGVPRGMTEAKTREIAQSLADQRLETVKSKLNPEAAKWVEDSGVKIRNYETSKEIAGTSVHFTKPELEVLQKNITEEYEKAIDTLRNNQRINGLSLSDKQRYVDVHLEVARKKAWAKTIREVRQGQK